VIRIQLSHERLAGARFAVSPLLQLVPALLAVRSGRETPAWVRRGWAGLSRSSRSTLEHLVDPAARTVPDFLMPYPTSGSADVAAELASVRATPSEVVRRQLSTVVQVGEVSPEFARARGVTRERAAAWRRPATEADRRAYAGSPELVTHPAADALEEAWGLILRDRWQAIHATLSADVMHRASQAASQGMERAVCDVLTVTERTGDSAAMATSLHVDGEMLDGELVLAPSVFFDRGHYGFVTGPRLGDLLLGYPSRGRGEALGQAPVREPAAAGLWGLLPPSRRSVLQALSEPRSGQGLASLLGLSPATVSHHLTRLRRDGLVESFRVGKQVIYRRSDASASLDDGAAD